MYGELIQVYKSTLFQEFGEFLDVAWKENICQKERSTEVQLDFGPSTANLEKFIQMFNEALETRCVGIV